MLAFPLVKVDGGSGRQSEASSNMRSSKIGPSFNSISSLGKGCSIRTIRPKSRGTSEYDIDDDGDNDENGGDHEDRDVEREDGDEKSNEEEE